MLLLKDHKFIQADFDSETEIEDLVVANAEYIFGPSSIYLPKLLVKAGSGAGTIPDGFVIDPSARQWYVVEVELAKHNVWTHIAPQVAKQIIAARQPLTKQLLIEATIEKIKNEDDLQEIFTELEIDGIDIRRVLGEILDRDPIIGMPIDKITPELREWAATLKNSVKLWLIEKHVEFGKSENIMYEIPEEFQPTLDTQAEVNEEKGITQYDVTLTDLVSAGLLYDKSKLVMNYKPKAAAAKGTYEAVFHGDGSIEVMGKNFNSPSYAALYVIQSTGSTRKTVNGWTAWKEQNGYTLAHLRDLYMATKLGAQTSQP